MSILFWGSKTIPGIGKHIPVHGKGNKRLTINNLHGIQFKMSQTRIVEISGIQEEDTGDTVIH